jgi:hypothetical protein
MPARRVEREAEADLRKHPHESILHALQERPAMTLCPIAIAVTCRRCAIVSVCPVKKLIGDYVEPKGARPAAATTKKK